jgi:siroheme synthase (precorrin-2 oxidase/ferrochelatase)
MPNFHKFEHELAPRLDKWLYFMKYLKGFQSIPKILENEVILEQAFEKATLAKLDVYENESYQRSLKYF